MTVMCGGGKLQDAAKTKWANEESTSLAEEGNCTTTAYIQILSGRYLCEAALWCMWTHHGDLTAHTAASYLELQYVDFANLLERYTQNKKIGPKHAHVFA